jgi:hypothetical protein
MLPLPGSGGHLGRVGRRGKGQRYVESLNSTAWRELQLNRQKNRRTELPPNRENPWPKRS